MLCEHIYIITEKARVVGVGSWVLSWLIYFVLKESERERECVFMYMEAEAEIQGG